MADVLYERMADTLTARIRHGDYKLKRFPGTRRLAEEFRVSHMVARQAVTKLVKDGVLARPNGRREPIPAKHGQTATKSIAFISPAYQSAWVEHLRRTLSYAAAAASIAVRPVEYVHWNDEIVFQAFRGFDGTFLVGNGDPMPPEVRERIVTENYRIVSGTIDLSELSIPSLVLFDDRGIDHLLEHLQSLGHRAIDCLNVQPHNENMLTRVADWRRLLNQRNLMGRLYDEPVQLYQRTIHQAYRVVQRMLAGRHFDSTALFCTTEEAAIGATRALREGGRRVPEDVSVVTISDIGFGQYVSPSLTAIDVPDLADVMEQCVDWLTNPRRKWTGDLAYHPAEPALRVGESTGPAPTFDRGIGSGSRGRS